MSFTPQMKSRFLSAASPSDNSKERISHAQCIAAQRSAGEALTAIDCGVLPEIQR